MYIDAIKINVDKSELTFKNICIYNVVPLMRKESCIPPMPVNTEYPILGTDLDRLNFAKYFNKKLKVACEKNNFIFFDVYDKYSDSEGFLIRELSDGRIHIKDGKYIKEFIEKNLL